MGISPLPGTLAGAAPSSASAECPDENAARRNPHVANLEPVLSPDVPELGKAAFQGDLVTVRRLISSGVRVDIAGGDGRTPLILAAAGGHLGVVSALLAAGANINHQDITGSTALHSAAERGEEKVALLLLSHRPKVNVRDRLGGTPLIGAAVAGDETIVSALIFSGANPDFRDALGHTAADYARKNKYDKIVSLLNHAKDLKDTERK
ncbi:MAG: hypothetical protein DMF24_07830 [Verrucomicrobia bacterium]|nr:MAG: hypothetical protein DMF24_07830 [Verrucomicrobiota bacterium]